MDWPGCSCGKILVQETVLNHLGVWCCMASTKPWYEEGKALAGRLVQELGILHRPSQVRHRVLPGVFLMPLERKVVSGDPERKIERGS